MDLELNPRYLRMGRSRAEAVTLKYLNARAASVYGGSQEVQKNIIAKAMLGL